jgi:hypothetical protein
MCEPTLHEHFNHSVYDEIRQYRRCVSTGILPPQWSTVLYFFFLPTIFLEFHLQNFLSFTSQKVLSDPGVSYTPAILSLMQITAPFFQSYPSKVTVDSKTSNWNRGTKLINPSVTASPGWVTDAYCKQNLKSCLRLLSKIKTGESEGDNSQAYV